MISRAISTLSIAVLLVTFLGCGGGNAPQNAVRSVNKTNMQRLANLYMLYQVQHKFQGPADEATFRDFLSKVELSALEPMGVNPAELDRLFINERDGEPFKVKYGVPSGPRGSKEAVVFEATGKGGKRMVGFLNMVQREVDASEYESLWGGKASAAPSGGDRISGGN